MGSTAEHLGEEPYMKGLPQRCEQMRDIEALRDQPQGELLLGWKGLERMPLPESSEGRGCSGGGTQPTDMPPRMAVGEENPTSLFSKTLISAGASTGQSQPVPASKKVQVMAFIGSSSQSAEKGKEG